MKSLLLSLLLVPALAMAADDAKPKKPGKGATKEKPHPEAVFKKLDTNSDGGVSLEEFKTSPRAQKHADKAEQIFTKLDKDSDGKVTLEEFKAHAPKKAPGKGGKSKPEAPKTEAPTPAPSKPEV